ncbi:MULTISPECIES: hypothetical protein [Acidovorax]|uniref:hypothetical protein n=1 Tax=Acidovorax TaxID=12916 RepID=UPI00023758A4|nr:MULTISPECIES: hypothetical protein [Acidovorax]MBD9391958.1 hypothetical protein [Acidovorax sp. ACV01]
MLKIFDQAVEAATDRDDTRGQQAEVRLLGGKLLIQDRHGGIVVFVCTQAWGPAGRR